ncbi:hypothetical protein AAHC03_022506 [Spirometra sp. Aus1]
MQGAPRPLLLVGVKLEETTAPEDCALNRYKVTLAFSLTRSWLRLPIQSDQVDFVSADDPSSNTNPNLVKVIGKAVVMSGGHRVPQLRHVCQTKRRLEGCHSRPHQVRKRKN